MESTKLMAAKRYINILQMQISIYVNYKMYELLEWEIDKRLKFKNISLKLHDIISFCSPRYIKDNIIQNSGYIIYILETLRRRNKKKLSKKEIENINKANWKTITKKQQENRFIILSEMLREKRMKYKYNMYRWRNAAKVLKPFMYHWYYHEGGAYEKHASKKFAINANMQ